MYGSESWMNGDLRPMEKLYMWCIKQLLGVRKTTVNSLCLVELGLIDLRSFVKSKQRHFFTQAWVERGAMRDDPLGHVINLILEFDTPTTRYIRDLLDNDVDDLIEASERLKQEVSTSDSSRLVLYKTINSDFKVHDIYSKKINIYELEIMEWTRLRLSSHSLAVEVGRWNRRGRGRLPMEERLCVCGQIQTEQHVIETCPRTQPIRTQYDISSLSDLLVERSDYSNVCHIVSQILKVFK